MGSRASREVLAVRVPTIANNVFTTEDNGDGTMELRIFSIDSQATLDAVEATQLRDWLDDWLKMLEEEE
jgi:hypothetical protein